MQECHHARGFQNEKKIKGKLKFLTLNLEKTHRMNCKRKKSNESNRRRRINRLDED
jgi:hypothetical protein